MILVVIVLILTPVFLKSKASYDSPHVNEVLPEEVTLSGPIDPLFEKMGYCESKHVLTAKNPGSTAKGEFQFLDGTWKYYGQKLWGDDWVNKDVLSTDNRELAWYVYTNFGTRDWESDPASYNCWKSEIPNATHRTIY